MNGHLWSFALPLSTLLHFIFWTRAYLSDRRGARVALMGVNLQGVLFLRHCVHILSTTSQRTFFSRHMSQALSTVSRHLCLSLRNLIRRLTYSSDRRYAGLLHTRDRAQGSRHRVRPMLSVTNRKAQGNNQVMLKDDLSAHPNSIIGTLRSGSEEASHDV